MTDRRLLLSISEQIPETGYPAPDVETCAQKSPFTIVKCTLVSMNWTNTDIPGCAPYIIEGRQDDPATHCKVFTARNKPLQFRINGSDETSIQRVDIYWKINNITAMDEVTLSIPALAIQFYAATFSPWRQSDIAKIPQQVKYKKKKWGRGWEVGGVVYLHMCCGSTYLSFFSVI